MIERLKKEIRKLLTVFFIGAAYFAFVEITSMKIPCPFYLATKKLCPGCGITRMIISAAHLDFKGAFGYNKALFFLLPILAIVLSASEIRYIKSGKRKLNKAENTIVISGIVILICFGIIRNIMI